MKAAMLLGKKKNWAATPPVRLDSWKFRKKFALTLKKDAINVTHFTSNMTLKSKIGGSVIKLPKLVSLNIFA